jgi:hypothetical protein
VAAMPRTQLRLALLAALVGTGAAASATPAAQPSVRATLVGDSVSASITYVPSAQALLETRGVSSRLDLKVCRRLVQASCLFGGVRPSTALEAVRAYGRTLGAVLIVNVGYNEGSTGYRDGIDRVMRTALAEGARGVVWVTLRETSDIYRGTNVAIRAAAARWPQLVVADWNAYSWGKPWFRDDGLHLTATGARALATFLRRHVLQAAALPAVR